MIGAAAGHGVVSTGVPQGLVTADATDAGALTRAFAGAKAVYAMIPPDIAAPDVRAYQESVSDALRSAIEKNGIKYAVALSSVGADKSHGTGPVAGLHSLEKKLEGITVRVFDPAKTVADCFKYRNKIGLEVALEALRDCYRQRKATMDELFMAAKVCRVARVIQPYLESLT